MIEESQDDDEPAELLAAADAFEVAWNRHDLAIKHVHEARAKLTSARARLQELCRLPSGPRLSDLAETSEAVGTFEVIHAAALIHLERAQDALISSSDRFRAVLRNYELAAGGLTN